MDVYGYDHLIVGETPDYLKCPLCHLVMQEPMLIVTCGHKFCGPCFRRRKEKTTTADQQLICPVDNAMVDTSQVVPDLGLSRVIGCLVVQCDDKPRGCQWEGELSELPTHHKKCEFALPPALQPLNQDVVALIARLENRIDVAEKALSSSEKEVAHMGCLIKENTEEIKALKLKDLEKTKEIDELKKRDASKTKEIDELKNKDVNKTREIEELKKNLAKKGKEIELGAVASGAKPVVRCEVRKKVYLKLHRGLQNEVTISPDNSVHFKNNRFSTVAAPDVVVNKGDKVVYEVKVRWSGASGILVGWATSGFIPSNNGNMLVGCCAHSWGYRALHWDKCHNNSNTPWGKRCERDGHHILGVALDMVRGQMLYGWDGVWDPPMGVAFNVDTHLLLFPAI